MVGLPKCYPLDASSRTPGEDDAMTLEYARKLLPKFAVGLGIYARTLTDLRDAVIQELQMYRFGDNPLTKKQAGSLEKFLERTR